MQNAEFQIRDIGETCGSIPLVPAGRSTWQTKGQFALLPQPIGGQINRRLEHDLTRSNFAKPNPTGQTGSNRSNRVKTGQTTFLNLDHLDHEQPLHRSITPSLRHSATSPGVRGSKPPPDFQLFSPGFTCFTWFHLISVPGVGGRVPGFLLLAFIIPHL